MDPTLKAVFFIVAVVCFVIAAVGAAVGKWNLVAAGLAFFATPFAWDAVEAA